MLDYLKRLVPRNVRVLLNNGVECQQWAGSLFAAPAPGFVKRAVLQREGVQNSVWIETGTYLGETTHFLSQMGASVISIEPDPTLFANAEARFRHAENVKILPGLSEQVLPALLPTIKGDVSFWLDGHYSGGVTYQGPQDCPVMEELSSIEKNIKNFYRLAVMIDDTRCFDPSLPGFAGYPSLSCLVDWATKNALRWHIEHDIFVAKNFRKNEPR